jgi:hypothetical protein
VGMAHQDGTALRVFTTDEALRAGKTTGHIRALVRRKRWIRLRDGVYCTDHTLAAAVRQGRRHELDVVAARAKVKADTVASHHSAAEVWGLPLPMGQPAEVHLTGRPADVSPRRYRSLRIDAAALPADHVTSLRGLALTTQARTVVDLARRVAARPALAVIDAALRRGVTAHELSLVINYCRNWPGAGSAASVLAVGDGRRETPLESHSAVMFIEQDLPMPEPQKEFFDDQGRLVARVDFYWEHAYTIGEADGKGKYADDSTGASLVAEKKRQEVLEDMGFMIVRWGSSDVTPRRAPATAARIRSRFAAAAARRSAN